jgi:hypothetical protein
MRLPVGASQYTNVVLAQDSLLQGETSPSITLQVLNSVTEQFKCNLCVKYVNSLKYTMWLLRAYYNVCAQSSSVIDIAVCTVMYTAAQRGTLRAATDTSVSCAVLCAT